MGEKAKLQPIYQRLNGTAEYHPLNAETFSDWSMEAGDAVTISRNGEEYVSPVHTATLKWTGQPKISVESTGSNEREPLAKMSIRQYSGAGGGGGSGYRNSLGTREHIELVAQKTDSNGAILRAAGLTLDAETGAVIYSEDFEKNSIGARIKVANDKIGMVVGTVTYDPSRVIEKANRAAFPKTGTAGYFYKDLSTGKIYMWSYGKYKEYTISADGKEATAIDAGQIAVAINEAGNSEALIEGDHIKIGTKGTKTVTLIGEKNVSIGLFDTDNNGNIGLANGYGIVIDEDGYGQGIWQKGELSAGMFIKKENEKTYTYIKGNSVKIGNDESSVNLADAIEVVNYNKVQSVKIKKQTVLEGNNLWVVKSGGSGGKITASDLTIGLDGARKIVFESSRGETAAEITRANAVEIGRTDQLRAKLVGNGNGSYKLLYLPIGQSSYVTSPTYTSFNGWLEGGNFSRATSLKESWSGSELTISGTPTQTPALEWKVQFEGSYNSKRTNLNVTTHGNPSVITLSGVKYISAPIKVERLTGAQSQPDTVYTKDLTFNYGTLLQSLGTVTTNGLKTPGENYVGFSSFTVDVPSKVAYDPEYDDGEGHTYKVVKASRTGQDYMRIYVQNTAPTASNNWIRTINVTVGGNSVESLSLDDYTTGFNSGNANRGSRVSGVTLQTDEPKTYDSILGAGQFYQAVSQYKNYDGTYTTDGVYKFYTSADPGFWIIPFTDSRMTTEWKNKAKQNFAGNLEYDTEYCLGYGDNSAIANVKNYYWKTKPDRWQDGWDAGYDQGKSEAPSYSHSAVIKCTGKVKTYPNSSIYNYTFTCDGASGALASVGDQLHVHW